MIIIATVMGNSHREAFAMKFLRGTASLATALACSHHSWAIHVVALVVKKDKKMAKSMVQMMDARRGQGFDQGLALAVLT